MAAAEHEFDPRAILAVLERNYVNYVLIGGLARVIRGADEVTRGVDISPSFARENLDRLVTALAELDARRLGGKALTLSDESLAREVIELSTSAGELKIVACPAGAPSALRGPATRRHQEAPRSRAAAAGRLDRRPRKAGRRASPRPGHRQAAQLRRVMELEVDRQLAVAPAVRGPSSTASLERLRKLDRERAERSLRLER